MQNIFDFHRRIMDDYQSFANSFVKIDDPQILAGLESEGHGKTMWPDPLLQFNPSYLEGESIDSLVAEGVLHPEMKSVFSGYTLHKHQEQALRLGSSDKGFIVTSGTGSGKSLTFLGTMFNSILRNPGEGVVGLIVYPMNALINSQTGEIKKYAEKFEKATHRNFPIRAAQYTGQEDSSVRKEIQSDIPHILLTNYMMLELLLTRGGGDADLKRAIFKNLKFIAFDELHTFRGRQGADVAMLIRRLKAECSHQIICMGTSATMAGGASALERKAAVASVGTRFFGSSFAAGQIIEESLRALSGAYPIPTPDELLGSFDQDTDSPVTDREGLVASPLFRWLEQTVALKNDGGVYRRGMALSLVDISETLAKYVGHDDREACRKGLLQLFDRINAANRQIAADNASQTGGRRPFILPYKLHQFLSQSGSVAVSLHQGEGRLISFDGLPSKERDGVSYPLFPVVFSRLSGKPFLCVRKNLDERRLESRDFGEESVDASEKDKFRDGYILPFPDAWIPEEDLHNLPPEYTRIVNGRIELTKEHAAKFPSPIWYTPGGDYREDSGLAQRGWFVPVGFLYDPTSGDLYHHKTSEFTKLTRVGIEGRSTATTILSLNVLDAMRHLGYPEKDTKIMSFADNRQDASLQSGHFNDLVSTVRLRSALVRALQKKSEIGFGDIEGEVFLQLGLPLSAYANIAEGQEVQVLQTRRRALEEVFKSLLKYRLLGDLADSWKVTLPGLESCGLLRIGFKNLDDVMADPIWEDIRSYCLGYSLSLEQVVCLVLDYFRKSFALSHSSYYSDVARRKNLDTFRDNLNKDWAPEDDEIDEPNWLGLKRADMPRGMGYAQSLGERSRLGQYVRTELSPVGQKMDGAAYQAFMRNLLEIMEGAGWLVSFVLPDQDAIPVEDRVRVYRLKADQIIWRVGDGAVPLDPVFRRNSRNEDRRPNNFFRSLYLKAHLGARIKSGEHTGQVKKEDRQARETAFRAGEMAALFCSPTMELGIDIADLSVVHMRNVPPNPASYAQRSGRAGRSGQPALVFTSCSRQSAHDAHFFKHPSDMVCGDVSAPRLDLMNQELLKSHFNALYLSHCGITGLSSRIHEVMDLDDRGLPLMAATKADLQDAPIKGAAVLTKWQTVISDLVADLSRTSWYGPDWTSQQLSGMVHSFDGALVRWRNLFQQARRQKEDADRITSNPIIKQSSQEHKDARRNIALSLQLFKMLMNEAGGDTFSEFYSFRYLASEGFLPGYNFTRLPVRLYLEVGKEAEAISRDRVLAIREMGPENLIYHNGSKYRVNRAQLQETANEGQMATLCQTSGYLLMGDEQNRNTDPFTGADITNMTTKIAGLMALSDGIAERTTHITCEEEERQRLGYQIDTYFRFNGDHSRLAEIRLVCGDDVLLRLRYLPSAELVYVNSKWRASTEDGFVLNKNSGHWKSHAYRASVNQDKLKGSKVKPDDLKVVKLYTTDTADALYIEPLAVLSLDQDGRKTLQYALKVAVERVFQIESSELGISPIGDPESPNLLMYEAAEGSLGVLTALVQDNGRWQQVIDEAWCICRFDDAEYKEKASYDDLLSYYNQPDHQSIDRFKIKSALERLRAARPETGGSNEGSYDAHFQRLMASRDQSSSTEETFLKYLYKHGLRLPDEAQRRVDGLYCQPDFWYKRGTNTLPVHVFCDGTPHDDPVIKERDRLQREAILDRGEDYFVFYYRDSLDKLIASRPDIFRKVR